MKVEFLARFSKDLDRIHSKSVKEQVAKIIMEVESCHTLREIPHVKKLSGFRSAYRIRLGEYRIGVFSDGHIVQFARIAHRKEIYRLFP